MLWRKLATHAAQAVIFLATIFCKKKKNHSYIQSREWLLPCTAREGVRAIYREEKCATGITTSWQGARGLSTYDDDDVNASAHGAALPLSYMKMECCWG